MLKMNYDICDSFCGSELIVNTEATVHVIVLVLLVVQILCDCEALLFNWGKVVSLCHTRVLM